MMIKQIEYFVAVVDTGNFYEAADKCHISQSAISQQIKALEEELGVKLLDRHNRTFSLTNSGELFYRKGTILLNDFEQLKRDILNINQKQAIVLKIGYLKGYSGNEFQKAVSLFSQKYPNVELEITAGNHEELFNALRREDLDIVLNDQRRAFSDDYHNLELIKSQCYVEVAKHHPFSHLNEIEVSDLKNTTCVLVASTQQRLNESEYYRNIVGITGNHIYADSIDQAMFMVSSGKSILITAGENIHDENALPLVQIPLYKKGNPVIRNYCAFWKVDNSDLYIEEFATILKEQF